MTQITISTIFFRLQLNGMNHDIQTVHLHFRRRASVRARLMSAAYSVTPVNRATTTCRPIIQTVAPSATVTTQVRFLSAFQLNRILLLAQQGSPHVDVNWFGCKLLCHARAMTLKEAINTSKYHSYVHVVTLNVIKASSFRRCRPEHAVRSSDRCLPM